MEFNKKDIGKLWEIELFGETSRYSICGVLINFPTQSNDEWHFKVDNKDRFISRFDLWNCSPIREIKEQYYNLAKRMLTWNTQMNIYRKFIILCPPNPIIYHKFNKNFTKFFITYKNRSKLIKQAQDCINQEFNQKPLKNKILELLSNSEGLIDFSFEILIPLFNGGITDKQLNKVRSRVVKKIKKFQKIGKII